MLGQGFRRGGSVLFNAGKGALSRRVMMQQRRALAMSVCLAHNISLANTAPSTVGSALPKVTTVDAPSLGLGQDLLSESPTMTQLMSIIEQMGLSHLFVSDAFYITLSSILSNNLWTAE